MPAASITFAPAGTATAGVYNGVQGQVQSANNGGAWDGKGITTSMPDAASGLTSIGVAMFTVADQDAGKLVPEVPLDAGLARLAEPDPEGDVTAWLAVDRELVGAVVRQARGLLHGVEHPVVDRPGIKNKKPILGRDGLFALRRVRRAGQAAPRPKT